MCVCMCVFHSMIPFAKHESAKRAPRSAPTSRPLFPPTRKNISFLFDFATGRRSFDETRKGRREGGREKNGKKKRKRKEKSSSSEKRRGRAALGKYHRNIQTFQSLARGILIPDFSPATMYLLSPFVAKFKVSLVRIARRAS